MSKIRQVIELLFRVYDKDGNLVDFRLNEIQARIDAEIITPIEYCEEHGYEVPPELLARLRQSILKYRQGGVSTLIVAWFLVKCMQKYSVCVMLTHDGEASEKLLYRARIMLKNLKGAQPETSKLNDNEIAFSKTNSLFYIGTAGSKEFGRSATINYLHCSEIAFWKDPARLMKSLFQAVPKKSGVIIQETTANGWGNWFQRSFYAYMSGKGGFLPQFFPWPIHEEYVSNTPFLKDSVDPDEWRTELSIYRKIHKLCPGITRAEAIRKLQWRREKLDENLGDQGKQAALRDFQQEYPLTIEEAFTMSGGGMFGSLRLEESPQWEYYGPSAYKLATHPKKGYTYALGADYAGGTGNDSSSIVVGCLETREQVYRFADNYIDPISFTQKLAEVGKLFESCLVVPETNAHGLAGIALLKKIYPTLSIYRHTAAHGTQARNIDGYAYGWKTTAISKPYMVGIAQQFIHLGFRVYDPLTCDQLRAFSEDPVTGKMGSVGTHDDLAIAFMLMCIGLMKLSRNAAIDLTRPIEEVMASDIQQATLRAEPAKIIHTHRDDQGRYLMEFDTMFGKTKQGRKSSHA